jgi:hypothetical protein
VSPDDVSPYEMSRSGPSDSFEQILAGRAHLEQGEAPDVKQFVDDVKAAFRAHDVPPAVESRHLAAMMETAHLIAHKGDPVVRPASKALGPAWQASGLPKRRRQRVNTPDVKRRLLRSPVGTVAAAMVAMFTIFSGVALAGVLPAPVQKAVANVADTVGIHLPSPADDQTVAGDDQGEQGDANDQDDAQEGDDQPGDDQGDRNEQGEDEQGDQDDAREGDDQTVDGDDQGEQGDANDQDDAQEGDDQPGDDQGDQGENSDEQGDENHEGESAGDQGNQDEQGDEGNDESHESDDPGDQGESSDEQGDETDQGDHESSGGGNDQGDEGNQGDEGEQGGNED